MLFRGKPKYRQADSTLAAASIKLLVWNERVLINSENKGRRGTMPDASSAWSVTGAGRD
jgi:hypothetical protein